jgi:hypothetical protein
MRSRQGWFAVALIGGLLIALRVSWRALGDPFVVLDDVRQHAFWVPRLHDPALFRGDPMADYFAAQATPVHLTLYFLATLVTDVVTFSKLLPLALTVLQTGFAFVLVQRLSGRLIAAALAAVLLAWLTWWFDDLASASPRSFGTPLLVVYLACLAGRQARAALVTVALAALCYPVICGVMLGTRAVWLLAAVRGRYAERAYRREVAWLLAGVVLALGLTALGRLPAAGYGPTISAEAARRMPEFQLDGRAAYFVPDPLDFWLTGPRTGLGLWRTVPWLGGVPLLLAPAVPAAGLALWVLAARGGLVASPPIPARGLLLLGSLLVASAVLFLVAHALAFRLYLPARQVQFSLPVVLAVGAVLFAVGLAEQLAGRVPAAGRVGAAGALAFVAGLIWLAPPDDSYVVGQHPRLYAYLGSLPKDTLVAAWPRDAGSLPLFARRPVLASEEHALPYHPAYYEPLRRRTVALVAAYLDPSPSPIVELAEQERAGVIVANVSVLDRARARRGGPLGLDALVERCTVLRDGELVAIPTACARSAVRS